MKIIIQKLILLLLIGYPSHLYWMNKGDIYQHYKNQKFYEIISLARHTETLEELVVYKALYFDPTYGFGSIWVRPKSMFMEDVQHENKTVSRFTKIGTMSK